MLFYFLFFKERLLALGVSYLKVGLKAPLFFFSLFSSSVFCFFIEIDSLVRFAHIDLKVTDQLPQFFPILNQKQRSVVVSFLVVSHTFWNKR